LLRVSAGLENASDLLAGLHQAFAAAETGGCGAPRFLTPILESFIKTTQLFPLEFPMDDEVRRAWELALAARFAACRTLSKPLIEDGQKRQLEGAVNSKSCFRPRRGPVPT